MTKNKILSQQDWWDSLSKLKQHSFFRYYKIDANSVEEVIKKAYEEEYKTKIGKTFCIVNKCFFATSIILAKGLSWEDANKIVPCLSAGDEYESNDIYEEPYQFASQAKEELLTDEQIKEYLKRK